MSISLWFCDSNVFLGFETNWKIMTQLHQIKLSKKRFLTFITTVLFLILHLVCKTGETIEGLGSLAKYKGCTEIDGNLFITIRGSGVSGKPYLQSTPAQYGHLVIMDSFLSPWRKSINFL